MLLLPSMWIFLNLPLLLQLSLCVCVCVCVCFSFHSFWKIIAPHQSPKPPYPLCELGTLPLTFLTPWTNHSCSGKLPLTAFKPASSQNCRQKLRWRSSSSLFIPRVYWTILGMEDFALRMFSNVISSQKRNFIACFKCNDLFNKRKSS